MKKFFSLATAAAIVSAAVGTPAQAEPDIQGHSELWRAIETAGVPIFINDPKECKGNWGGGAYMTNTRSNRSALLICQNNGQGVGEGNQVAWTANDYDTLRHEAHHIVQDCLKGTIADGEMSRMYPEEDSLREFVTSALAREDISRIIDIYGRRGGDEELILIELEAFSVASTISPSLIADAVTKLCPVRSPIGWK